MGLTMELLSGSAMRTDTPGERRIDSEFDCQDFCKQGLPLNLGGRLRSRCQGTWLRQDRSWSDQAVGLVYFVKLREGEAA